MLNCQASLHVYENTAHLFGSWTCRTSHRPFRWFGDEFIFLMLYWFLQGFIYVSFWTAEVDQKRYQKISSEDGLVVSTNFHTMCLCIVPRRASRSSSGESLCHYSTNSASLERPKSATQFHSPQEISQDFLFFFILRDLSPQFVPVLPKKLKLNAKIQDGKCQFATFNFDW